MSPGDLASAVLLPLGAAFSFLGALGVLTFPDVFSRLHAATKPQTIGLLLILAGAAPQLSGAGAMMLLLVALFQIFTAPVIAAVVGSAAYRAGVVETDRLVIDELADGPGRPREGRIT